jgi:hypothetical protein
MSRCFTWPATLATIGSRRAIPLKSPGRAMLHGQRTR